MFRFGRHEPSVSDDTFGVVTPDAMERERRMMLERWRTSEQRVWRSWKAWIAADAGDRGARYRLLVRALAEEEKAAGALELLVRMLGANRSASV